MRAFELEHEVVRNDLPVALERAKADIAPLEAAAADAVAAMAVTETELTRLRKTFNATNAKIASTADKLRNHKKAAMEAFTRDKDAADSWNKYYQLRGERERLLFGFQYLSEISMPDAQRALMIAQIAERESAAALLEAKAVRARVGALVASMGAADWDPGFLLDTGESWSATTLDEVSRIREEITDLEKRLKDHDKRTASHRELSASSLWS